MYQFRANKNLIRSLLRLCFLLLDLANHFVEVVVTGFVVCVVSKHLVFIVVASLVVKSTDEAD